jgi:hypothetical protein
MTYYGTKNVKISREALARILAKKHIPREDLGKFGLLLSGKVRDRKGFGVRLSHDKRYISATELILRELCGPILHILNNRQPPSAA